MTTEKSKSNLRVFFSYAAADGAYAQRLRAALPKQPHVQVFTTDTLSTGENWIPKLKRALSECDVFVVLLSPNALVSNWVLYELGAAWGLNKPIIPVATHPKMFDEVPLALRDVEIVDIKDFENSKSLNQILERYEAVAT